MSNSGSDAHARLSCRGTEVEAHCDQSARGSRRTPARLCKPRWVRPVIAIEVGSSVPFGGAFLGEVSPC
jgi:hypothetical protein